MAKEKMFGEGNTMPLCSAGHQRAPEAHTSSLARGGHPATAFTTLLLFSFLCSDFLKGIRLALPDECVLLGLASRARPLAVWAIWGVL